MDWHQQIDQLLSERRPDRYEKDGGDGWLDEVASEVAGLIPTTEAQEIAANLAVRKRETVQTKRTNKILRDIHASRQLPIDWLETLNLPLAVGKERVALRACRPDDYFNFAIEERRRAANDFTARNDTCEAAEWIGSEMLGNGWQFGRDINL